jgi:flavin-dependent dehydrogenase
MREFDTIIVGAGLAGLQCARLLAERGISVLLVDRRSSLDQAIHTTGIFVRKTLEDFDIPDYCLGPVVRHVDLYSPSLRVLHFVSEHDEFRIGRMGKLYQHYLDLCVRNGVTWQPGVSYVGHCVENGSLIIRLADDAGERYVRARYIIGADGARSRVAVNLDLELNSEWLVGVEKVFTGAVMDGPPRLLCFLDPAMAPGYVGWIAYDGQETHLGVAGYPSRFDPLQSLKKFQAKTEKILDLRQAQQIEQRGGRIPVGGVLRRISNEHGLLIGDAAGAVSPLTAGGLDPCMRLSALAANVVTDFLKTGSAEVLAAYSGGAFRARFVSRLWARRLASAFSRPFLAELAFAALSLPMLKPIANHIFFSRGSFPDVDMSLRATILAQQ